MKILVTCMRLLCLPAWLCLFAATSVVAASQAVELQPEGTPSLAVATFAGGCFWCLEPPYDALPGVIKTVSGFSNGHVKNPSYKQVSRGGTGHVEVVQVTFDPNRVSYAQLLEVFWVNHDPLDLGGQFCDRGATYRPAILTHTARQREQAEVSKKKLNVSGRLSQAALTPIEDFESFYPAETYHQNYYQKNPLRYKWYRGGCHRDERLSELWGDKK